MISDFLAFSQGLKKQRNTGFVLHVIWQLNFVYNYTEKVGKILYFGYNACKITKI